MESTQQLPFPVRTLAQALDFATRAFTVALMLPVSVCATAMARRIFLAVAVLNVAFPIDINFGYREEIASVGALGGWNISLTTFALIGLYVPLMFRYASRGYAVLTHDIHWGAPLGLYILCSVVSLFAAQDVLLGLREIFLLAQLFLLYLYVANSVTSRKDVDLMVVCLLLGLLGQAIVMIASYKLGGFSALGDVARVDEQAATELGRVGGTVGSPNSAAAFAGMAMAVAGGVLLSQLRKSYRIAALLGLFFGLFALVLTFTRGGWMAFGLSALILMIYALTRDRRSRKTAIVMAAIAALVVITLSGPIRTRLTADDQGAAYSRIPLMRLAGLMIADHPVFGVGANNFATAMEPYVTRGFSGEWVWTVHNKYLLVMTEVGPIGAVAFIWFFLASIRRGIQCWGYRHPAYSAVAVGCMAALAGHMLQMMGEPFRARPTIQLVWLLGAMLVVLHREIPAGGLDLPGDHSMKNSMGSA